MKKVICLVLAAVLALSLAACGSKDSDNKGGDTALLLGFGAGLSYAGAVVTLPPAPKISSFDGLDQQPVGPLPAHLAAIEAD